MAHAMCKIEILVKHESVGLHHCKQCESDSAEEWANDVVKRSSKSGSAAGLENM